MKSKFAIITLSLVISVAAHAESVSFHSGNGQSAQDQIITALEGSQTQPFQSLSTTQFTEATQKKAYILCGFADGWVHSLNNGSDARWIGVDQNGWNNADNSHSGLYDQSFSLHGAASMATLTITFSVDDQLGDSNQAGMFIDGKAIAGSNSNVDWNHHIETKTFDLGALSSGRHDLDFNVINKYNGPSGIIFSGNVCTQAVPAPSSFLALGIGLIGLVRRKRN